MCDTGYRSRLNLLYSTSYFIAGQKYIGRVAAEDVVAMLNSICH